MKTTLLAAAILSCATALNAAPSATLALKDGSTLRAELKTELLDCSSLFAKELPLDPSIVKSIAFTGTNGEAKVELVNGDRLTVTIANQNLAFTSILGDLNVPRANVRSMSLSAKPAQGGDGLIFHCTFDDEAAITSPSIGPKGLFLKGMFLNGIEGKALQTTVYSSNAAFELPPNFFGTAGCIEFWAKIQNRSSRIGNGGDPRLFTITQKSTSSTICTLDIVSNNGGGNSGFATWTLLGNMASLSGLRALTYDDLLPNNPRGWHHYAIVWNADGISTLPSTPRTALLVDGKLITDVQNHVRSASEVAALIESPMRLSFTHDPSLNPEFCTKSPFLIDEFKIWNYDKTDFPIE